MKVDVLGAGLSDAGLKSWCDSQKSKAFLYINNVIPGTVIRKNVPFSITTRKIKYLGTNLTNEVKTCTQKTTQH